MKKATVRYLYATLRADLDGKMAFVAGPRQVGKTTLARAFENLWQPAAYWNWDQRDDRRRMVAGHLPPDHQLLILDEIHKYPRWKTLVKGLWDKRPPGLHVIVTGSSRLDVYRRGGDSLQGRYHAYRLHPFSLGEVVGGAVPPEPPDVFKAEAKMVSGIEDLLQFGGFPEPFMAQSRLAQRRWHKERFERVFREDIRDLESIRSLGLVETLAQMLPERVGSPFSHQSMAGDLDVSPATVRNWMELLCRNYYIFRVPAYHGNLARAIKKESKYYLWDWSEVAQEGPRFENLMASHLLKYCHFVEDAYGWTMGLWHVRDRQGREVDFMITRDRKPWMLVECKRGAGRNLNQLRYFAKRLAVAACFQVTLAGDDYIDRDTGVRVIPAGRFLAALA
jgi:predicted AAA+ superfamily ATPase